MKAKVTFMIFMIALIMPFYSSQATEELARSIIVNAAKPSAVIKLQANPTTGYTWLIQDYDHRLLTLTSHEFEAKKTKAVGAPGLETWTFQVKPEAFLAPQLIKIKFYYTRVWDISSGTEKIINIITQNP